MNNKKKHTILVVDDDKSTRTLLTEILADYEVIPAGNGPEALEKSRNKEKKPDLILLDLVMPRMRGDEVCKRLKADENTLDIPIFFLTIKKEPEYEEEGLKIGAVDYISKPINTAILKARIQTHLELKMHRERKEQKEIIFTLGEALESRSEETANHVRRVSLYSSLLATKIGLSKEEMEIIKIAVPMHDIGKIGIPDSILNKPGKLNPSEWKKMQEHPTIAYKLLKKNNGIIMKSAATIAYQHHENWDGTGYPQGLKGEKIDIYGRIAAIADVFDALSHKRCYRKEAWPIEEIIQLFKDQKGKQFDPIITQTFLDNTEEFIHILSTYPDEEKKQEN